MLFVWAFGDGNNEIKRNWARAVLIWYLLVIVFLIIFYGAIIAFIASLGLF